jgi:hypothetical protein
MNTLTRLNTFYVSIYDFGMPKMPHLEIIFTIVPLNKMIFKSNKAYG